MNDGVFASSIFLEQYLAALSSLHINGSEAVRQQASEVHVQIRNIYHKIVPIEKGWPLVAQAQQVLIAAMRRDLDIQLI